MKLFGRYLSTFRGLCFEKKVLYISQIALCLSLFTTWSSTTETETTSHSAFGSVVGFNAYLLLIVTIFALAVVLLPFVYKKEVLPKHYKKPCQFVCGVLAFTLALSSLGILTKTSWLIRSINVEFGLYITLLFSLISLVYSVLLLQQKQIATNSVPNTEPAEATNSNVKVPNAPEAETHTVLRNLPK